MFFVVFVTYTVNSSVYVVSDGRFIQSPVSLTIVANTMAVFQCQHSTADVIVWNINGSYLRDIPDAVFQTIGHGSTYYLTVVGCPEYNQTVVECVAVFIGNILRQVTSSAIMMIQGINHTNYNTDTSMKSDRTQNQLCH